MQNIERNQENKSFEMLSVYLYFTLNLIRKYCYERKVLLLTVKLCTIIIVISKYSNFIFHTNIILKATKEKNLLHIGNQATVENKLNTVRLKLLNIQN